jgi:hypothetical protein
MAEITNWLTDTHSESYDPSAPFEYDYLRNSITKVNVFYDLDFSDETPQMDVNALVSFDIY